MYLIPDVEMPVEEADPPAPEIPEEVPEVSPPETEEPMRETDPAFMGASHIPAPSPDEMYAGERFVVGGVQRMFENPSNRPYDPRDTRGQLPQTGST